ncbi:nitric oxide reductase transcriptional regulator NorR [Vibrio mediterranei]|uniref:nitric oxide reductase transcriptional regulator NorR n=1 Tax=Vibrio mediterranei TaxID=689 RepID=UPI001EFE74DD|nr:nitric oxide reductase transcriptional regulator NorR [Vibrio mediterranei]MCG9628217.1 nitric oxide reductase transcriptional regulator NorR [Vibrio mediterranei]
MQDISPSNLMELTIGLASSNNDQERFDSLINTIRKTIMCDCVALLSLQGDTLVPLAMQGLGRDTLGRRFVISEHPRFAQICASTSPVIFDADSELPDPFDGLLIDHHGDLPMHSCMGLPLIFGDKMLGALTLDSLGTNAFDHIPTRSLEVLSAIAASTLKMALTFSQLEYQAKQSKQLLEELNVEAWERDGSDMIGDSELMRVLKSDIEIVAPSDFNILIHGETGVGKELVARNLHYQSTRRQNPLVYVNCAAIPENLIESELFGHVKGAFTGADKNRMGKFALADGGTLFLDEIGELPLAAQSKLLRALQNNEIQPVGKDEIQKINVRVLAATNRELKEEVEQGKFRADLYHRLSVYPISVPPLRDRNDDIELLAGFFLEQARRKLGINQIKLSPNVISHLNRYSWPGNVRELEHVINRAALKAKARLFDKNVVTVSIDDCGHFDDESRITPTKQSKTSAPVIDHSKGIRESTEEYQRNLISNALIECEYNWAKASRVLKTDRANLIRLSKRLGISVTKSHTLSRS